MVELAQKQRVLLKPERVRIRHVKHQHINAHDNTNWQRQQGKKNRRMKKTKLKATKASSRSKSKQQIQHKPHNAQNALLHVLDIG